MTTAHETTPLAALLAKLPAMESDRRKGSLHGRW